MERGRMERGEAKWRGTVLLSPRTGAWWTRCRAAGARLGWLRRVRGVAGVLWVRAGGVARARRGGPLRARSVVIWAAPATSGTGVGGVRTAGFPRQRGAVACGEARGGEGERGGHGAGLLRRCHGDPLADQGARVQGRGRQQRLSSIPADSTTPRRAMRSGTLW